MSAKRTEHYRLRLWGAGDRAGRGVFNGNAAAVDTALKALEDKKCEVVLGSYAGNGAANRVISLGFTPKAVILVTEDGRLVIENIPYDMCGGIFFPGMDLPNFKIVTGGFRVSNEEQYGGSTNSPGVHYYMAFR